MENEEITVSQAHRFTETPGALALTQSGHLTGEKGTPHISVRRPADHPVSLPPRELGEEQQMCGIQRLIPPRRKKYWNSIFNPSHAVESEMKRTVEWFVKRISKAVAGQSE
jgi:hypothetical protein